MSWSKEGALNVLQYCTVAELAHPSTLSEQNRVEGENYIIAA